MERKLDGTRIQLISQEKGTSTKRIWLITDTHWYHKNIIEYEHRPKNFNELIIENWAKLVHPDDVVIHLGDVIFKKPGSLTDILHALPGTKILTMGNHDNYSKQWYKNHGFDFVFKYFFYFNRVIFSHHPLDLKQFPLGMVDWNIHGHFHTYDRSQPSRKIDFYPFYCDKHLLLSLENENYKPVLLNDWIKKYSSRNI